jgi:AcrR family transcriptional regulator
VVTSTVAYSTTARQLMRAAALRAAREQVLASHWDQVRMADIAVEVGVSRQTLYNEFGTKDGLARALLTDDVDQSLAEIAEVLDAVPDGPDPVGAAPGAGCPPALRQALAASASHVITRAHDDPLHKAILTSDDRELLPLVTVHNAPLLEGAHRLLAAHVHRVLPQLPADAVAVVVDAAIRLTVSHVLTPATTAEQAGEHIADLVTAYCDALLRRSAEGP